jgi:minimal PKS acyl carrier protein
VTAFGLARLTELMQENGDRGPSATPLDGDIADVPFEELGFDSLALFNTCIQIEGVYPVKLSLDDVLTAQTPAGLIALVNSQIGQEAA